MSGFSSLAADKGRDVYISPMLKKDLEVKRHKSKSTRGSAMTMNRKTSAANLPPPIVSDIGSVLGPLPL